MELFELLSKLPPQPVDSIKMNSNNSNVCKLCNEECGVLYTTKDCDCGTEFCGQCLDSFYDDEELDSFEELKERVTEILFTCKQCNKKIYTYNCLT